MTLTRGYVSTLTDLQSRYTLPYILCRIVVLFPLWQPVLSTSTTSTSTLTLVFVCWFKCTRSPKQSGGGFKLQFNGIIFISPGTSIFSFVTDMAEPREHKTSAAGKKNATELLEAIVSHCDSLLHPLHPGVWTWQGEEKIHILKTHVSCWRILVHPARYWHIHRSVTLFSKD